MGEYKRRNVGDIISNDAVLVERVSGRLWKIRCSCGNLFTGQPSSTSGRCCVCGAKIRAGKKRAHGEAPMPGKKASRLHMIWSSMRSRCNNKRDTGYNNYGGRGIVVCGEWDSYLAFKKWALENGYADDLTLDRVNVDGDYCPENCRWATLKEQGRNRRNNHLITYNGETKTLVEWSESLGIDYQVLKHRINDYGFSVKDAFEVPVGVTRAEYHEIEEVPNED